MNNNKNILYTGAFRFPDKDAAAFRVKSVADCLRNEGFNVDIAGWEKGNDSYEYDGFKCYPQHELDQELSGYFKSLKRLLNFLLKGKKTFKWINNNNKYDAIILYNPFFLFSLAMFFWGRIRGRNIIIDSTEWYESEHLIGGRFGLASCENWMRMNVIYPKFDNVICISNYLKDYYDSKGVRNIIKLYPMYDEGKINQNTPQEKEHDKLVFFYAGQPGKKDIILDFIGKLEKIQNETSKKVIFKIAGSSIDELIKASDHSPNIINNIKFVESMGVVSREEVFQQYRQSDYSILFREDRRYAHAGFPTKGMESLINGCPIILNDVGDIASIVKSDSMGLCLNSISLEQVETFRELVDLDFDRAKVCTQALLHFGMCSRYDDISRFMKNL
ncbi:glycosyltransferase [Vibrio sp. nBUS_14]|uniref:glycosyltransferase n=1 Tax=Vibrio sp. nBUS_14 TaxID=3395321 RepID=UPI003EBE57FD